MNFLGVPIFDVLFVAALLAGFFAGFVQGLIRRLLGIASFLVAFYLAADLRDSVGSWLAGYWTQFPAEYVTMLAFGILFIVLVAASSLAIQIVYRRASVFEKAEWADELIGGGLGVVQVLLLAGIVIVILDSYFGLPSATYRPNELPLLRPLWNAIDASTAAAFFRDVLIPAFVTISGPLVPVDLRALFHR